MRIEIFGGKDHAKGLIYLEFDEADFPDVINVATLADSLGVSTKELVNAAEADGWEETLNNIEFEEEDVDTQCE
ncbi:hypothetical protein BAU67_001955 [Escherichia coli]|nr:hypothetical protein [Escherichia coli]EMB7054196.1 hypothetical protein [Escherichia coli]